MSKECLTEETRQTIIQMINKVDKNIKSSILFILEKIPVCGTRKRKQSEYQKFMSQCMRDAKIKENKLKASEVMKECARKWNEIKKPQSKSLKNY